MFRINSSGLSREEEGERESRLVSASPDATALAFPLPLAAKTVSPIPLDVSKQLVVPRAYTQDGDDDEKERERTSRSRTRGNSRWPAAKVLPLLLPQLSPSFLPR